MLEGLIVHSKLKKYTLQDGTEIAYREWHGKKNSDVIIYLHGLLSHMGWFMDIGNLLNKKGLHIYAVDRRGAGLNQKDRGHMESYWVLIDDVKEIVERVRGEHPGKKVYLMGLCWGGKIAVTFAAYHQDIIDGLVLVTPAIKSRVDLPLKEKMNVIFNNYFHPRKLFDVPLYDHMFTKKARHTDFIVNDELKLKKATARFFFETGKMNLHFNSIAHKIHIPVLALLAGDDLVVDNEKIQKWFEKIGSKDKSIKIYQGCYHSLNFEEPHNITDYIADWIRREDAVIGEENIER